MPFSSGKLIKTGGRKRNRFGISLNDLPPFLQKFILNNNQLKEIEDDRHLKILFKMREREFRKIHESKIFICPFTNQPATLKEINENSNKTNYQCYHCETEIISTMDDFSYKNLTCQTCYNKDIKYEPNDFILYTEKFRKIITQLLTEERKTLIKYIKYNSKA